MDRGYLQPHYIGLGQDMADSVPINLDLLFYGVIGLAVGSYLLGGKHYPAREERRKKREAAKRLRQRASAMQKEAGWF